MALLWSLVGSYGHGRLARCRSYGAWLVFVGMVGYQGIAPTELGWFSLVWSVSKMPLLRSLVGFRGYSRLPRYRSYGAWLVFVGMVGYRDGAPMELGWFSWAWSVTEMALLWSLIGSHEYGFLSRCAFLRSLFGSKGIIAKIINFNDGMLWC